jgi:hypothetical protein
MSDSTFRVSGGGDPVEYLLKLKKGHNPTVSDMAQVGLYQAGSIQRRTSKGVDVNGRPFAPYSRKGPIRVEKRKYASYDDYKRAGLGRSTVDLAGRGQHMRQAVAVRVGSLELRPGLATQRRGKGPTGDAPASEVRVGVWDERLAMIGSAHNTGARTGRGHKVVLPKREWFGVSNDEQHQSGAILGDLITDRLDNL